MEPAVEQKSPTILLSYKSYEMQQCLAQQDMPMGITVQQKIVMANNYSLIWFKSLSDEKKKNTRLAL